MVNELSSRFAEKINDFLDYRVARGFKRETYLRHFIKFDRWCIEKHPDKTQLERTLVHEWIDDAEASVHEISHRAAAIRQFGRYLAAIGENAYILPDKYAPIKSRSVPYLFTDSELTALFAAIDRLPQTECEPFLNEMVPTLFRLIYTCGLRPNEGRELQVKNINLDTGEILIQHTKRNKERFVVMSDDMLELARKYNERRKIFSNGSGYFFPSADGGAMKSDTVYSAFNRAWSDAGLQGNYPRKVRVYDLRHRFASACINQWLDNGENLMAMLPFLREYMGHKKLSETAYYIHILPENMRKSSAIDWDKFNAMFPEVENAEIE